MTKVKKNLKRKHEKEEVAVSEKNVEVPSVRSSDDPAPKKVKWINKQRVLVLALRGITFRDRHLLIDVKTLLPHSKPDNKVEKNENLTIMNEIAEMKNCNKCILFENRKKRDLYLWFANINEGPSCKFLVENVYTMKELKLTGNCLVGSRPLLSFDETFKQEPHYMLLKELLTQIFSTPNHHPKSQPFIDHVLTFTVLDNRIWFRNYQILTEDGALTEIGPRFVLNPIKLFAGSFCGEVLWENPNYISPAKYRQNLNKLHGDRYLDRKLQKTHYKETKPETSYKLTPLDDLFHGDALSKAQEIVNTTNVKLNNGVGNAKAPKKSKLKKKLKKVKKSVST